MLIRERTIDTGFAIDVPTLLDFLEEARII